MAFLCISFALVSVFFGLFNSQQTCHYFLNQVSKDGKIIGDDGCTINLDGSARKKWAVNFTNAEMAKLSKFCTENREIIDAEITGGGCEVGAITIKKQQEMWQKILEQINAMGIAKRDIAQLKWKWNSIKSNGNVQSSAFVVFLLYLHVLC